MSDLLDGVLEAHGGLDRWHATTQLTATVSADGPFWDWRGWPGIRRTQTLTIDTRREHITISPFSDGALTATFSASPARVEIRDASGAVIEESDDPLSTYPPYTDAVKWGRVPLAYFMGTANWNYFVEPFLFTYPGVTATEVDPWREGAETWRRLAVTFPSSLPNHNASQVFYYGDDLLLRRMDYSPDVTGRSQIAHYVSEPLVAGGLVFYGQRSVHLRDADGIANLGFAPITIRTTDIRVCRPGAGPLSAQAPDE
jgi:hypothetical protein